MATRGGSRGELSVGDRCKWRWSNETATVLEIEVNEDGNERRIRVRWASSGNEKWYPEGKFKAITVNGKALMDWQTLENLLKYMFEFRELYEQHGLEELTLDGGLVVNIHDIMQGIEELPKRQREAVILVCIEGRREVDAARIMGFKNWSSQVKTYKRLGLKKLLDRYWNKNE